MGDCGRITFHGFDSVAILDNRRLEFHRVNVVRHATEVNSCALFALVHDLLDVDGAELVLEALGLARGQHTTRFDHVDTYLVSLLARNDVNDAHVGAVRMCAR